MAEITSLFWQKQDSFGRHKTLSAETRFFRQNIWFRPNFGYSIWSVSEKNLFRTNTNPDLEESRVDEAAVVVDELEEEHLEGVAVLVVGLRPRVLPVGYRAGNHLGERSKESIRMGQIRLPF